MRKVEMGVEKVKPGTKADEAEPSSCNVGSVRRMPHWEQAVRIGVIPSMHCLGILTLVHEWH